MAKLPAKQEIVNQLYFADCLDVLKKLYHDNPKGFIDLIYIDPPFNSKRNYNILFEDADLKDTKAQKMAFADTWSNISYKDTIQLLKELDLDLSNFLEALDKTNISKSAVAYLTTMAIRIWYMHKVLKDTGTFYLHCDPTMSHYLKILCDLIFGNKNFLNNIVWSYHRWTNNVGAFISTHDDILFYSKNYKQHYFIQLKEAFSDKSQHKGSRVSHFVDGKIEQEYTEDTTREKAMRDVWEISYLNSQAKERLGYPTQKPEELLERVINSSCPENGLVADFFCGCGTTIAVAQKLNRHWLGVDISHLSIGLIERKRLIEPYEKSATKPEYEIFGLPKDIDSAKQLAAGTIGGRLKFQDWIIETKLGGIHNPKKTADGGWDGHITFEGVKGKETILIEVKSGHVNVKNVREFIQVINKQKVAIGVFVCFEHEVTKPMLSEAKDQGYYGQDNWGMLFDKIQIITVEDLLNNKNIKMPFKNQTFKVAQQNITDKTKDQGKLSF